MAVVAEVKDLKVAYRGRPALLGITFGVNSGESIGLLGANGAGKTSTLKALLGMVRVQEGNATLFGEKPGSLSALSRLGFAPEDGGPPEYLVAREYLCFVGDLRLPGQKDRVRNEVNELLTWFDLSPDKKIREYSKGMKKRLVLAQAFLGSPELLILDEPLNGLDPVIIIKLRERVAKAREKGACILYSSHILAEVEKTCSRVIILDHGQIVLDQETTQLLSEFGSVENAFSTKVGGQK